MSENSAPGEKPKFEGILSVLVALVRLAFAIAAASSEQRVSALLMAVLTGLSVFFTHVLGVRIHLSRVLRHITLEKNRSTAR